MPDLPHTYQKTEHARPLACTLRAADRDTRMQILQFNRIPIADKKTDHRRHPRFPRETIHAKIRDTTVKKLGKFRLPALIFAVFTVLLLIGNKTYAEQINLNCTGDGSGSFFCDTFSIPGIDWSIPFDDASFKYGDKNSTVISSSTPYTILAFYAYAGGGLNSYTLKCGNQTLFAPQEMPYNANTNFSWKGYLHCSSNLTITDTNDAGQTYFEYVPYDTRNMIESTSTMPVTDTHFGIVVGFAFMLATMIFIIWLYKGYKRI